MKRLHLPLLSLILIILNSSCQNREVNEFKSYSFCILESFGHDPLSVNRYQDYDSKMIAILGFELKGSSLTIYKNVLSKRYTFTKQVSQNEKDSIIQQIATFSQKKGHGQFGQKKNIQSENRIYCGPSYVITIGKEKKVDFKFINENLSDFPYIDSMYYQICKNNFLPNSKWNKLNNFEHLTFILSAEQFANIVTPNYALQIVEPKIFK